MNIGKALFQGKTPEQRSEKSEVLLHPLVIVAAV